MKKKNLLFPVVFLIMFSCTGKDRDRMAGHVILIGLDGWGSYSIEKAEMPNVKKLMEQGCFTLKKRSIYPASNAANWASMFMGAGPELHGYTEWGFKNPELPSRVINKHGIFPSIFSLLRESYPQAEIGCMYEWEGIIFLVDRLSLSYSEKVTDYQEHPSTLCDISIKYVENKKPDFAAIIFNNPDGCRTEHGGNTTAYYQKLNELDEYIGRIIEAVEKAGIIDDTIFIITSAHGGMDKKNGGKTVEEMEAPFIIAGKNICRGGHFQESMVQFDVASTIAYIFNVKQPQVWIGRPMVQVFDK